MDFSATQIYDDEDFPSTQRIACASEEDQSVQVGTLTIDSVDHQIRKGIIRIGRLVSCDIVISDPSVSKVHAEIEAAGGSTWICDLDSSNKTKLNNLSLRPKRSYELKDESVIEFGKVRAIYRTYQPDDTMILETPAPSRKIAPGTIIPNTPDSSLNTSSGTDGSIIFGTQRNEENSVFRRPLLPQRQSTSKKALSCSSTSESDDGHGLVLHVSDSDTSENRGNSIFDAETQNFEARKTSVSIHDIETQIFPKDDFPKPNVEASEQSTRPIAEDKMADSRATDICGLETQRYANNISELETQVNGTNVRGAIAKNFVTNIHDLETQVYVVNNDNNKDNNRDTSDLEMQNFGNNISDLETQVAWNSTKTANRDITDMETQFASDDTANDISDDRANAGKTKAEGTVNSASRDNATSKSGSCSPASLNLSSPGIDEDRLSSRLNQSGDLLESTELLEFFNEGIENQVEAQTSTPKPRASSERNNNVEDALNTSDNEDHSDDDNIFEAPTQRIKIEALSDNSGNGERDDSKKREKPRSKQADSDETDVGKDLEEPRTRNNKNDPGTSVESVDMYDMLTQKLNDGAKDTGTLPREVSHEAANSKDPSSENNRNDMDDAASTQIADANIDNCCTPEDLDRENEEYEMAPTQVIGETEERKNPERDVTGKSAEVNLNDTLERNLNEMFDSVASDTIDEPQMLSTQILEDILESSCDHDLSADKSKVGSEAPATRATKNSRESRDRSSRILPSTEAKIDNVNIEQDDSQDSDIYFSNITTRRKRNIIRDTQEFDAPVGSVNSVMSSRVTRANDNSAAKSKGEKRDSQKNKNDATIEPSTDDDASEEKDGGRNYRKLSLRRQRDKVASEGKALEKNLDKAEVDDAEKSSPSDLNVRASCSPEDGQRVRASSGQYESDDDILNRLPAVRISGTLSNPPSPSASSTSTVRDSRVAKQAAAKSGAKKNDASKGVTSKMLQRQRAEDFKKDGNRAKDKSSVPPHDDHSSSSSDSESNYKRFKQMADRMLSNLKRKRSARAKMIEKEDTCSVSSATKNLEQKKAESESGSPSLGDSRATRRTSKRGEQNSRVSQEDVVNAADEPVKSETKFAAANRKRILSEKEEGLVGQSKSKKHKADQATENRSVLTRRRTSKIVTGEQSSSVIAKTDSRENSPVIASTKSLRTTKAASRASEDTAEKAVPDSGTDESVDTRKSNARQTRSKFPSIVIKTNNKVKRANLPATRNTDSSKTNKTRKATSRNSRKVSSSSEMDENVDSKESNVKRSSRKGGQVATHDVTENEENHADKQVQAKGEETKVVKQQNKVLKIQLTPIKSPVGRESQEVEIFMKRGRSNVQDQNLSIREQSSAKIFSRASRTRSRKRSNTDSEITSVSESSGMSSDIDSDKVQSDTSAPKAKRGRIAKNSVSSRSAAEIPVKEETFKRPTRVNKKLVNSVLDSSSGSSIVGDSQDGSESGTSSSSRLSRSKTAKAKRTIVAKQTTLKTTRAVSTSSRMSVEVSSVPSTPSRTRRSASVFSNSSPNSAKHRILFTGIAEDYSKLVKTLGGIKVEEPAKCTVLVTDKVRRTYKFLCALAMGIPIVAIDWLRDSEPVARFLDWENYILKDPAAEAKFSFRLRKSLDKAREKKLLDGYTVVVTPNVAPPPIEELKNMVTSCGGKVLLRPPTRWPEKAVVITREEDLPNAKKFIAKAPNTVTVQSTEFILTGILRQEADFDKYKLL